MATQAILGRGTLIKRGDGATPEVFTTIPGAHDIRGPEESSDRVEITSHDSDNSYREYIAGLRDAGEISFDLRYLPANAVHQAVHADFVSGAERNYQLHWSNGVTITSFRGLVTGFSRSAPVGGPLNAAVTITLTGPPTDS